MRNTAVQMKHLEKYIYGIQAARQLFGTQSPRRVAIGLLISVKADELSRGPSSGVDVGEGTLAPCTSCEQPRLEMAPKSMQCNPVFSHANNHAISSRSAQEVQYKGLVTAFIKQDGRPH